MNINSLYPATYLKAADLGLSRVQVTIAKITLEDVGQGEMKPVMTFLGKEKGIVLNKTNGQIIAGAFGQETDAWIGQTITLFSHKVNFNGQMVDGIAVMAAPPNIPAQPQPQPQPQAAPQPQPQPTLDQAIAAVEADQALAAGLANDIPF